MLIKTDGDRKAAYDSVINLCLQDKTPYCNNCGAKHDDRLNIKYICCDAPEIGNNMDHARAVIKQNQEIRKSRLNEHASTKNNDLRWGISIPRWIYAVLDEYEKSQSSTDEPGRRLLKSTKDIRWFAKNYPQFSIPEKI